MIENLDGKFSFVLEKTSPSLLGERIYNNFAQLFLSYYPQLKENPVYDEIAGGIPENYNFSHLSYALEKSEIEKFPILFIDQFEELFSDSKISEDNRLIFLRLIRGLIGTQRVFIIISMRNDFYSKFASYVDLGLIKQQVTLTYDMPTMGTAELASIIREPARMAGLEWDLDKDGNSLDREIVNEAAQIKNLPLIEFALSELYKYRSEKGVLTFDSYKNIGGLKGAFTNYANGIYNSFSTEEKKVFQEILGRVITVSNTDGKNFVRKTAILSECSVSALHAEVIRKVVDAHIFTSGKNAQGEATLTIVHEMLITTWDVIYNWIEQEKTFISDHDYYEKSAQHWVEAGKPNSLLLKDEEALLKAEYFYYWWEKSSSANTIKFLKKSFLYKSLLIAAKWGIYSLAFLLVLILLINSEDFENSGEVAKEMLGIGAVAVLLVPMMINLWIHLQKKPYFKIARTVKNMWLCFSVAWVVITITDMVINPVQESGSNRVVDLSYSGQLMNISNQSKNEYIAYNYTKPSARSQKDLRQGKDNKIELPSANFKKAEYIINILIFLLIVLQLIHVYSKYRIRNLWKNRNYIVPLTVKYFNREKYRIGSTVLSAFSTITFISISFFAYALLIDNNKLDSARIQADLLNNVVEGANAEIGLNTNLFYSLNEVRDAYLNDLFPDSIKKTALPNDRKYELARTYYYRSMPDSVIALLRNDKNPEHQTLLSYAYLQKGNYVDAAKSLPKDLDTLLAILPNYWMKEWTPIDVFVMAGDYKSAKQYCDVITKIAPDIKEHPLYHRIRAMLNVQNLDSLKSDYTTYMFYYYYSLVNDEKPLGSPILFSPLIWTNQMSYKNAQEVLEQWNEMFDDSKIGLAIIDAKTLKWPDWLNGTWRGLQESEEKNNEWTFAFDNSSLRFEIDEIEEDNSKRVNDHGAWPCRYIKLNGNDAVEALNHKGSHFVLVINKETKSKMEVDLILDDNAIPLTLTKQ